MPHQDHDRIAIAIVGAVARRHPRRCINYPASHQYRITKSLTQSWCSIVERSF